MKFETIAVHAGGGVDEATGAVAPPIHLSTTFARDADLNLIGGDYQYIREANPTQLRLESALAALDGGSTAIVFASGVAAGAALLQSLPRGTHLVLPDDCYYGFRAMANEYGSAWGVTTDYLDMQNLESVRSALRGNGSVLWAESPSNPLMKIVDLAALSALAKERGAILVVDGTFATPALQRPIELGADVVLHSSTKYFGGHSDAQGGALIFAREDELAKRIRHARHVLGSVASPFNSWLVLRGLKSLSARMRMHCENGMALAKFLSSHGEVEQVFYPGLEAHTGHEIAARQMSAFGGMLSFNVRGGGERAKRVVSRCRLFTRATSLGGTESLIEHRATSEGAGSTVPEQLIRASVGLENVEDLIADLAQALSK